MPACRAGIEFIPYIGKEGGSTDDETHNDKRSEETEVFQEVELDGEW